jgi:predicted nuclease with TOPRIM domain
MGCTKSHFNEKDFEELQYKNNVLNNAVKRLQSDYNILTRDFNNLVIELKNARRRNKEINHLRNQMLVLHKKNKSYEKALRSKADITVNAILSSENMKPCQELLPIYNDNEQYLKSILNMVYLMVQDNANRRSIRIDRQYTTQDSEKNSPIISRG